MFQECKHKFYSSTPLLIRTFHVWAYLQVGLWVDDKTCYWKGRTYTQMNLHVGVCDVKR